MPLMHEINTNILVNIRVSVAIY